MEINEYGKLVDTNNEMVVAHKTAQLLDKFDLNWIVEKQPLLLPSGSKSGLFGIVRKDTDNCFTSASEQYEIFQNAELAELVQAVGYEFGIDAERGGMFNNGGKVYFQLGMNDKRVGDDVVKRWATAINSHDGSTALKWGSTGLTISCSNSFTAAAKSLNTSVRHYKNMRNAVDESVRALRGVIDYDETLFDKLQRMASIKAEKSDIKRVVAKMTSVDLSLSPKDAESKYSTRLINQTQDLVTSITKEMSYKGDTLWGLFSGVTHYTTHKAGRETTREVSKMMGSLQRKDQEVLEMFNV
jgi:hypothetical protein